MYIRVGIADDHKLLCDCMKSMLEFGSDYTVVFQCNDGTECIESLKNNKDKIDVLLLDVDMPSLDGFQVLRFIKENNYNMKVLFLTGYDDIPMILQAIEAGADGYLLKDVKAEELITAIRDVNFGKRYIQTDLLTLLEKEALPKTKSGAEVNLTERERQILAYVAGGANNKEIALELDISEQTVKNHLTNIFKKINVFDRTQATIYAIKNKIIVL